MQWMLMPFRRYADFSGRSRRKEYWMFTLFMFMLAVGLGILSIILGHAGVPDILAGVSSTVLVLVGLILFIPSLAVTVRRFHDQDKSGWLYLLNFLPIVGPIVVLALMCAEGTRGPNRFGPDPKSGKHSEVAA